MEKRQDSETATNLALPDVISSRVIDDLLWACARQFEGNSTFHDWATVEEVLSDYTIETLNYSDGSPVGIEYRPHRFQTLKPPHRRMNTDNAGVDGSR